MKNLFRVSLFASVLAFALFSCNHGTSNTNNSNDPELTLVSMTINKVEVKNEKVSIEAGTIESKDIVAKFKYGTVTEEEISVVVEGSSFSIAVGETKELSLKVEAVKNKYKEWTGKVSVTGEKPISNLLSGIIVIGGRDHGKAQRETLNKEKLVPILKGEGETIQILGPVVRVLFLSEKIKWNSIKVKIKGKSDKNLDIQELPKQGFKSVAQHVDILIKTEPVETDFEIVANGETLTGKLKLARKQDLADIPELMLFINGKEITKKADDAPKGELLEVLWDKDYEITVGEDSAKIQVASLLAPLVKSVSINGTAVQLLEGKISTMPKLKVAELEIKDLTEQPKEVTVEFTSAMPTICRNVSWKFKIKK